MKTPPLNAIVDITGRLCFLEKFDLKEETTENEEYLNNLLTRLIDNDCHGDRWEKYCLNIVLVKLKVDVDFYGVEEDHNMIICSVDPIRKFIF